MQTITDIRKFVSEIESATLPLLNEADEDNTLLEESVRIDNALTAVKNALGEWNTKAITDENLTNEIKNIVELDVVGFAKKLYADLEVKPKEP